MAYKVKKKIKRKFTKRQVAKGIGKEIMQVFSYMKDLFLFIMKGMAIAVSIAFLYFMFTDIVEPTIEHFQKNYNLEFN